VQPFTIYTHRQRPELEVQIDTFGKVWPEFIFHGEALEPITIDRAADVGIYMEPNVWMVHRAASQPR